MSRHPNDGNWQHNILVGGGSRRDDALLCVGSVHQAQAGKADAFVGCGMMNQDLQQDINKSNDPPPRSHCQIPVSETANRAQCEVRKQCSPLSSADFILPQDWYVRPRANNTPGKVDVHVQGMNGKMMGSRETAEAQQTEASANCSMVTEPSTRRTHSFRVSLHAAIVTVSEDGLNVPVIL